jgi:hypothetical protein
MQVASEWTEFANLLFSVVDTGDAELRVDFEEGQDSWSYAGTDSLSVPGDQRTINLGPLTLATGRDELRRVVLHEFGHALGLAASQQSPIAAIPWNKKATYEYYAKIGWTRQDVDRNIFTKYDRSQVTFGPADPDSIMYHPIPGETTDGKLEIRQSSNLSDGDKRFIADLYPAVHRGLSTDPSRISPHSQWTTAELAVTVRFVLPMVETPHRAARTYRGDGLLESDETVLVSRPFDLKVGLSPAVHGGVGGSPPQLTHPEGEQSYALDVQLFADGFGLAAGESWQQRLMVSPHVPYPTAVVHLIARPIPARRATRSITATFSIEGETLGAATRQLIVTADAGDVALIAPAPTTTGTNVTAPTGEPPADVTITITRGVERGVLQWGITSKLPGVALPHDRPAMSDVGQEPKAFATAIVREFFVHDNQVGVFQLLQGIGKTIAALIPQTVRTALETANAAVAPRPLDVLLLTEEAYVPWELAWIAHPFDKTAPPYLGAQANVGRWVLDGGATPTDPPRQVDAATMAVVWGVYHSASLPPLAAAEAEAKKIQKLYGASSIDARPDPVFGLLGGVPPADILHFAVHGRYDPLGAGDGIYLVEGPPIDPFQIRGSDLSSRAPFVFLNACQVGSGQELLGSYGGIAQAFLQVGASAVVAPLWSIDDEIAQHIALEFYHQALAPADAKVDGHPAGDATPAATDDTPAPVAEAGRAATTDRPAVADLLRRARAGLVQNAAAQSSTYLAYQFYGHPSLRLSWHGEHAKGGHHDG